MSVAAAAAHPVQNAGLGGLWKDFSLESSDTKVIVDPSHREPSVLQSGSATGTGTSSMALQSLLGCGSNALPTATGLVSCPTAGSTFESGLIWQPGGQQLAADDFIMPGQQLQPHCHSAGLLNGSSTLAGNLAASNAAAAAARAYSSVPEEFDSDDDEGDYGLVCKQAVGRASTGRQGGAAEGSSVPNIKQFTASSRKQLTSKFR